MMSAKFYQFLSKFYQYLFSGSCPLCHEVISHFGFCHQCMNDLQAYQYKREACPICARESIGRVICGKCQNEKYFIDSIWVGFYYQPPISTLLHRLKYGHSLSYAGCLKELLISYPPPWLNDIKFDQVIAVPLSKQKLFSRGFNQSQELAKCVAKTYSLSLSPLKSIRRKHNIAQASLNRKQRFQNIRGAFSSSQSFEQQNILLIDDVVTTAATLNELAKTLKKLGAKQVFAWTLLRR